MSQATWYTGDALTVLRTLPDASVDLVMTSPPFLALRSYLPADHEHKAREIGSEATPGAFLDVLLDVTEELARVLAPHGSLVVELGDTYSGSGGAGGDYAEGGMREDAPGFDGSASRRRALHPDDAARGRGTGRYASRQQPRPSRSEVGGIGWPLAKSLCMIPSSYAWALAYGRNPWTGRTTPPWRVRNLIAWCRPNPPVGALGDKFRPGTSYLTVACKSAGRYFDLDAVREPFSPNSATPHASEGDHVGHINSEKHAGRDRDATHGNASLWTGRSVNTHAGAPPLDWWEIPTHPYPGSHYATFPPELCVRPIKSMTPMRVCRTCGKPSERITGEPEYPRTDSDRVPARLAMTDGERVAERVNQHTQGNGANTSVTRVVETLGWSDCGHDNWRNGLVCDPFAGSGTTLAVATGHGRDAIGIDLDPRNYELARQRIGMFLTEAVA